MLGIERDDYTSGDRQIEKEREKGGKIDIPTYVC